VNADDQVLMSADDPKVMNAAVLRLVTGYTLYGLRTDASRDMPTLIDF